MTTQPNQHEVVLLQTQIPVKFLEQLNRLVEQGWYNSTDEVVLDALRHLLDYHRNDLAERYIREDVEWGLKGRD